MAMNGALKRLHVVLKVQLCCRIDSEMAKKELALTFTQY